ncbi:MAG: glycoside hydrolase family 3 protein, partial [Bacteroidota bacterium]
MKTPQILFFLLCFNLCAAQTYLDPTASVDERVEDLIARMTLSEKVGQMTMAERGQLGAQGEHIKLYFLGAVLSGGGSAPGNNSVQSWVDMYNDFQQQALNTRLGIPILYGTDAVHGNNNLDGAVIFPHNIGLGCTNNTELIEQCARITALEVAATGVDWTFSPCITVPRNERWGRTYEGFGEAPEAVSPMGVASIKGYQTDSLGSENSILACAKHFIADGGTTNGIDQGNTVISEQELRDIHLKPYIDAVNADVGSVMITYSSWNGLKTHGDKYLVTDVLKEELGFEGIVLSDWKAINQLGDFKNAIAQSINAGLDMAMQPDDYISFINFLKQLVNEDRVSMDRIDDAVRRVLRIKFQMGLFENPYVSMAMADTVGSKTHRATGRQAVRESLVLLKNDGVLPLAKNNATIVLAGSKANDIGVQCGGWSISWQGSLGNITEGTTIKTALEKVVGRNRVRYTASSNIPDGDLAVVVVGEEPYAEGAGDRGFGDSRFYISEREKEIIDAVKAKGIPMVVILLSGRPIMLEDYLDKSNAFV